MVNYASIERWVRFTSATIYRDWVDHLNTTYISISNELMVQKEKKRKNNAHTLFGLNVSPLPKCETQLAVLWHEGLSLFLVQKQSMAIII